MQFNNLKVGESVLVSEELIMILEKSYNIRDITEYAFDISVGPLVELWGFGFGLCFQKGFNSFRAPKSRKHCVL